MSEIGDDTNDILLNDKGDLKTAVGHVAKFENIIRDKQFIGLTKEVKFVYF